MSVIYCERCDNYSDTDFHASAEAIRSDDGEQVTVCEKCADDLCEGGDGEYVLLENYDHYDESMDGDHESGLASAGFGTDEDYGYFGGEDY